MAEHNQLFNEKQVAEMLCVAVQTLRNHRHQCRGIPYVKMGRAVRYRLADVEAYIQQRLIEPEAA